jgi:hypothetical protein
LNQQETQSITARIENHRLIVPDEREVITVWMNNDDMSLHCAEFGMVHDWQPALHVKHNRWGGCHKSCVHRLQPMEKTQLLCPDWISKLGWQPQVVEKHAPVIASRVGDTVTLAYDAIGPTIRCTNRAGEELPQHRYSYQLFRMRWWDEDAPSLNVLLGVAA